MCSSPLSLSALHFRPPHASYPLLAFPSPPPPNSRWVTKAAAAAEGPSCLYVGPLDTASQEMLEALYSQARDSYYSGKPLIIDDMFDKVELKLRIYGSKSVVKYPRCSLKRQLTYADAQVSFLKDLCSDNLWIVFFTLHDCLPYKFNDLAVGQEDCSLILALASIWMLLLMFGVVVCFVPTLYKVIVSYEDAVDGKYIVSSGNFLPQVLRMVNDILFIGLGYVIGYPIASASVSSLLGLLKNDLVALRGSCPNCGEEVFAFVKTNKAAQRHHRAECHVCESILEYRTKVETLTGTGRCWVYGRVYLVR